MKKQNHTNSKGVTLVALIITIVVLIIIASIATYSGIDIIRSSRLTSFTTEMKIMQTEVNELYEKWKNGEIIIDDNGNVTIQEDESTQVSIGKDLTYDSDVENQASYVLIHELDLGDTLSDLKAYRYFDYATIEYLGIEGTEGEFFVNIADRKVVSFEGFRYDGVMYYTLEQLPQSLYNVDYNPNQGKPTFDLSYEAIGDSKWRITISNIQYDGYINKWDLKYKKDGEEYWNTSEDSTFLVTETGNFVVKLVNGNIESDEEKIKIVDYKHEKEGLLIYYDVEGSSLENGTEDTMKIWKDISGNNNDITLNNIQVNEDNSLSAIDTTTSAIRNINVSSDYTIEVVAKYDTTDIGYLYALQQNSICYSYLWNYSDNGNTLSYRYKNNNSYDVFDNITNETTILNKKYLISITFNVQEKTAKIYANGEYIKSVTLNYYNQIENTTLLLFNSPAGDKPLVDGAIYSFRLYDKELTEEQIKNNFTLDQQKYQIP